MSKREVVFIDPSIENWEILSSATKTGIEIVILDPHKDGMTQIANWSNGKTGYDTIHIASHGSESKIHIGSAILDNSSIQSYKVQLESIGAALSQSGDILIYGCNVSAGDAGKNLIQSISTLTSADVSASIDLTGQDGNWILESKVGEIESSIPFEASALEDFQENLAKVNDKVHTYTSNTWAFSRLAADSNNTEHLIHKLDGTSISIKTWNGNDWLTHSTITTAMTGNTYLSDDVGIAIDDNDHIHITYRPSDGSGLTSTRGVAYGYYDGNSWSFSWIQSASHANGWRNFDDPLITTDTNGKAHLIYQYSDETGAKYIRYATNKSGSWQIENIATGSGGIDEVFTKSIKVASNGDIYAFYEKEDNQNDYGANLYYKVYSGGSWSNATKIIDNTGDQRYYTSHATLDGNDKIHITYSYTEYNQDWTAITKAELFHKTNQSGSWQTSTIVSETNPITASSSHGIQATGTDIYIAISQTDINYLSTFKYAKSLIGTNNWSVSEEIGVSGDYYDDFIVTSDNNLLIVTEDGDLRNIYTQAGESSDYFQSPNARPTLSAIGKVTNATEDTQKEISFADLQGLADEADADGTVVAFVIKAVSSGSLKIGADAASATAWNATTNAVVDASKKAFWTPAADANGDLNAFTVVARDDQGADSATPVTVVVATQSVNDAPRIDKLNGDAGSFTPGIPQYIDAQPTLDDAALILDDNANFAGGYLRVQQTSGATDGRFYFYGELLSAGSNITTISIGGKVIGQVDALEDGQNGRPLTIRLNADATHANGLNDLLGYLQYTADSAGSRSFSLVLNDGALDSSPVTFSLNGLGVTNVTSSTANGTYKVGDVVSIQLTFNDTVTVTGTPSLTLETGTTDRIVNYASGSGSTTLTFNYTVQAGDTSSDLDYLASSALALNGGSIRNADDLDVALTLPQPGATASLGHNKAILIDGLAPSDIALSNAALTTSGGINATVGALTSTDATVGDTFTYSLVSGSGDTSNTLFNIAGNTLRANDAGTLSAGTHSIRVRTTDAAGNTYEEALNLTVTSNPTVTLSSDKATLKAGETAIITFTFSSEPVGFAADDIVVTGGSLSSLSGSGTVYTATFTPQANAQNIGASLSVAANTFSDGALNNAASNTLSLTGDTNIPTLLSIARQTPADAQTNADSLTWRLTFSEAVTGLDASDFSVGGTSATVTSVSGSGSTWDVTVSGGDLAAYNGTATLALAGGHDLADAAGNPLTQNTPSGSNESYTLDNEAPLAPTLSLSADTGPSDSDGVTKNGSVIVGGLEAGASWQYSTDGGLSWSTGSGNSFVLSAGTYAANAVQARQTDGAGNVSSVGSHATGITVDTHVPATPSLSLSSDTGSSNGDGFSTQGAIVVGGLENGANWEYSTDGGLNWSTGSGNGFTLGEGSYASGKVLVRQSDIAGNTSANGSNTQSIEIDTTAPTLGDITRGNLSSPASNSPFTVQVSFADSGSGIDASTLDAGDITLTGPGSVGTLSVSSVSYDSNTHTATYTVAAPGAGWSSASHAGTYTVAVNADQVRDLAGNAVAANAAAHTFKVSFNSVEIPITQGAFNGRSVTLVTDEGLNIVQASNAGATGLPRSLKLPLGNFAFEIEGLANGATANLSMIVDPDMQSLAYYKKDNADKWVNLTKAVTYLNNGKVKIDFQLTDGGAFDRDALANGRIQDPGGLGFNALTPFVREGTTAVAAVGFDDDAATFGVTLQYAITGGADAAAFDIDPISGALSFKQAPSFAAPTDLGDGAGNNTYQVEITASGGTASAEPRLVTVTVLSETGSNAIVAGNPAPVFTNVPGTTQSLNVGSIAQLPDFTVSDTDSAELTLTLTATNGTIGGLVDMDTNTAGIQLVGSPSHITTQLAAATFTSQSAGAASITLSASDAVNDPVIVTYNLNVAAPSSPEPTPKPDPIIPPRDSWTDLPDNDGDGIPEQVENLVPSLGGVAGDGNGDGIPDIQQSEVASVPFRNTQQVSQDPDAPVVFVTLVGGSENGVPRSESSVKITSAQQLDAPADKPADLAMPLGLIGFTAVAASSGSTETFSLLIDGDIAINGYWKQNTQGTWVNLASAEYGGRVVTENGKTRLDFTITDGGQFDDDGKADGIISDPGAPGWFGSADSDKDQFPDTLEAQNGLSVGTKDNDVFTSSKFFVMQLYRDILGREAEQTGLDYWQQKIDAGTLDRATTASAFLDSTEFQNGAGALTRLYLGGLGRLPDNDGLYHWLTQLQGKGNLSSVARTFSSSNEFTGHYSQLDNDAFIDKLYQNTLGRLADNSGKSHWQSQLSNGQERAAVLLGLTESAEYRQLSDAKVTMALNYIGLLGRSPDPTGNAYWLEVLGQQGDETGVIRHFLTSSEYHDRFLPSATAVALVGSIADTPTA